MSETRRCSSRASHIEGYRFRVSFCYHATQCGCDVSPRRAQDFEITLQRLFGITNQRQSIEFVSTTICEDKEVAPALYWNWRRDVTDRSEEHTSELQSRLHLVCRL